MLSGNTLAANSSAATTASKTASGAGGSSSNPPGYLIQTGVTPQAAAQSTADLTGGINQASQDYSTSTQSAIQQMMAAYGSSFNLQDPTIQSGAQANTELNYLEGLPALTPTAAPTQAPGESDAQFQQAQQQWQATNPALQQSQNLGQANAGDINGIVSNLPGFQAQMQQGTQAIQNADSANGMLSSGNLLTELQTYGQGQESTYYNNYINQLATEAGAGNTAAAAQAGQDATEGQNLSTLQTNLGTNQANAALATGQAQSTGILSQLGSYQNQYTPTIDPQYTLSQDESQYATAQQNQQVANQQAQSGNSYYTFSDAPVNPTLYGLNSSGNGLLSS